jgi:hypothetical protein
MEADGETAEILADARKLARSSGAIPGDAFERAYGRARKETVITLAIDLGRALMNEGPNPPEWHYTERRTPTLSNVRTRVTQHVELIEHQQVEELHNLAFEKEGGALVRKIGCAFTLALQLDGVGGLAEFCMPVLSYFSGDYKNAAKRLESLASSARNPRWRWMARISRLEALIADGRIGLAFRDTPNWDQLHDRDLRAGLAVNRLTMAVLASEANLTKEISARFAEIVGGTSLERIAWERVQSLARRVIDSRKARPQVISAIERLVDSRSSR